MSQMAFNEKSEVRDPSQKDRRPSWIIRIGLVVLVVEVVVISPMFLMLAFSIGYLILYSRLPYRLRGLLFTTLFSRDLSGRHKHDHDS